MEHNSIQVAALTAGLALFAGISCPRSAEAQSAESAVASPSATAGMTEGLPGVSGPSMQMMQVRTAAQQAQGDAALAQMARSAQQSVEEQHQQRAVAAARETRQLKTQMRDRMRWERSEQAYNRVSAGEMSSWQTQGGGTRVEREVPDPFIQSLIAEEEARGESAEPRGFNPLRGAGRVLTTNPFAGRGRPEEPASTTVTPPASNPQFIDEPAPRRGLLGVFKPRDADTATVAATSAPSPSPEQAVVGSSNLAPGMVPRISGAALVDGSSPVSTVSSSAPSSVGGSSVPSTSSGSISPAPAPRPVSPSSLPPEPERKRGGLFSFSGGGGGLFGGKTKSKPQEVSVDAGLFPSGAVDQAPRGGELAGGYTASDVASDAQQFAPATGPIQMPGEASEEPERRGLLGRAGDSVANVGRSVGSVTTGSSRSGNGVPTTSTIHAGGNDLYVVTSQAQFVVQNEDGSSEVRALRPGTSVRMTGAGENWASVILPNGERGIIQNKDLRPSSGG
ncbi:MAG: hypothetical protein AAF236_04240 [Verrucomicrobiota bacterium]